MTHSFKFSPIAAAVMIMFASSTYAQGSVSNSNAEFVNDAEIVIDQIYSNGNYSGVIANQQGGSYLVTVADGKTLTIKNGTKAQGWSSERGLVAFNGASLTVRGDVALDLSETTSKDQNLRGITANRSGVLIEGDLSGTIAVTGGSGVGLDAWYEQGKLEVRGGTDLTLTGSDAYLIGIQGQKGSQIFTQDLTINASTGGKVQGFYYDEASVFTAAGATELTLKGNGGAGISASGQSSLTFEGPTTIKLTIENAANGDSFGVYANNAVVDFEENADIVATLDGGYGVRTLSDPDKPTTQVNFRGDQTNINVSGNVVHGVSVSGGG